MMLAGFDPRTGWVGKLWSGKRWEEILWGVINCSSTQNKGLVINWFFKHTGALFR